MSEMQGGVDGIGVRDAKGSALGGQAIGLGVKLTSAGPLVGVVPAQTLVAESRELVSSTVSALCDAEFAWAAQPLAVTSEVFCSEIALSSFGSSARMQSGD